MSATRLAWPENMLRQRPCSKSRSRKNSSSSKPEKRRSSQRLEEEIQRKQEEEEIQWRKEQRQRDLAHCLEADRVTAVEQ